MFLFDQIFILADVYDATKMVFDPPGNVEEQKAGDGEDDIEKARDVSDQDCSSKCGPSALERLKVLFESLSVPLPNTVVEGQQLIEKNGLFLSTADKRLP